MIIIKIISTILLLIIPAKYLYRHIYNISIIKSKETKMRLIKGMSYILLVAFLIDIIVGILIYIWL